MPPTLPVGPLTDAIAAYEGFDLRKPGWMKVSVTVGDS